MSQSDLLAIITVVSLFVYFMSQKNESNDTCSKYEKEVQMLKIMTAQYNKQLEERTRELRDVSEKKCETEQPIDTQPTIDPVIVRDIRVTRDPLYPPVGRMARPEFDSVMEAKKRGLFDYPTRGAGDSFRSMGYLVNSTDSKDVWSLYGRQKYRGSSHGEFYAIRADTNSNTPIKVTLEDDMFTGEKIRDVYNLPKEVSITSPLFTDNVYNVVEMKQSHFTTGYI
jgi:hypothetical protein